MRAGLSIEAIGMLERGVRTNPRVGTVIHLAEALRLSPPDRELLIASVNRSTVRHDTAGPRRIGSRSEIPHELPRAPSDFVGRTNELSALRTKLEIDSESRALIAISGMGGVGKSALAIQTAHRLVGAMAFPDGQLYVNLQGATAGLAPLEPLDALGRILRSLGQDPATIPAEVEEAAARFRSLAAERRLLILLDNARSAEQVRPLMPGSLTCGVLITSRHVLGTLEGCHTLHLDVLPEEPSLELLGRIAGSERLIAEPQAAAELARCCGGLPLAIRIVGARLAARPISLVRELAAQLADTSRRLEVLEAGELAVRSSFEVSAQALRDSTDALDQDAAAAFGLLSLPDGPDLSVATAARIIDESEVRTHTLLERLVDAQLLESTRHGRYQFHDLVRLYARDRIKVWHTGSESSAALVRGIGFYTATAWRTLALLRPGDWRLQRANPRWSVDGLQLGDDSAALSWLEEERANLLAAILQSARILLNGETAVPPELPSQLAGALYGLFHVRGYLHDWVQTSQTVLEIAQHFEDRSTQASVNNDLGLAYGRQGRVMDALVCLRASLAIFCKLKDRYGQSAALGNLGNTYLRLGRHSEAMPHLQKCLAISRELGDRHTEAIALTIIGVGHLKIEQHTEAIACQLESLEIYRELRNRNGQTASLSNLGFAYGQMGRHEDAITYLQEGLAISQEQGSRLMQANTLNSLGVSYERIGRLEEAIAFHKRGLVLLHDIGARGYITTALRDFGDALKTAGRYSQARATWQEALTVAEELQTGETDGIRARLASLNDQQPIS
jgi:tetratricopeptide (TPR) repeat protein